MFSVVMDWARLLVGDPNNQAPTIAAVTTNSHMKFMTVTLISPAPHPLPGQQFNINRPSPPMRDGRGSERL